MHEGKEEERKKERKKERTKERKKESKYERKKERKKKNKIEISMFNFLDCEEMQWNSGAIYYIRMAKDFYL